jgi:GDPmannose 4,6-dehydratase
MTINKPDDFVISTGKSYSIKHFVNMVCKQIDLPIKWIGSGLNEKAINIKNKIVVSVKKSLFRPHDVNYLLGDCSKARKYLSWRPRSIDQLIKKMVQYETNL